MKPAAKSASAEKLVGLIFGGFFRISSIRKNLTEISNINKLHTTKD